MDDMQVNHTVGFDRYLVDALLQKLRMRAYYLWLDNGRPDGYALDHWCRAEDEITFRGH